MHGQNTTPFIQSPFQMGTPSEGMGQNPLIPPKTEVPKSSSMSQFNEGQSFNEFGMNDPFSSMFNMPNDQPEFENNVFSSPFTYNPQFDPSNPFGNSQSTSNQQPQTLNDIFGFPTSTDPFMTQDQEDDDEDDWLTDEQFPNSNKQDPENDMKPLQNLEDNLQDIIEDTEVSKKVEKDTESAFRFKREPRERPQKSTKTHTFKPKLRAKKNFEKMFDKQENDEKDKNNLVPDLFSVQQYWDILDDPSYLEALNLFQNPFAYHLLKKRNTPPQFYINRSGPLHISDVFIWFNQGSIGKTSNIMFNHPHYNGKNEIPCYMFESFFNNHCHELFSSDKAPADIVEKEVAINLQDEASEILAE